MISAEQTQTMEKASALNTIVVATDGSIDAHLALYAAADLAKRSGAGLQLVSAYDLPAVTGGFLFPAPLPADFMEALEAHVNTLLRSESEEARRLGATVVGALGEQGSPVAVIDERAAQVDADLIVTGSRDLGMVQRLLVGSVSDGVLRTTHRPVLIVRGGLAAWPPAHVIVGFDDSPESLRAASLAAVITTCYRDTTMALVQAVPHVDKVETTHLTFGDLIEIEHDHVQGHAEGLEAITGRKVRASMVVDDPVETLLAEATSGGASTLIAVGTRGLGPARRFFLGSVSAKLLHSGHTPLLVVPGGSDRQS
jgi:nucleotide-binding universal stress UspA family protein